MKILITSPSLDMNKNVSGISSLVSSIMSNTGHEYFHFSIGRYDTEKKGCRWLTKQVRVIINFKQFLKKNAIELVHLNSPLEKFAIVRDYFLSLLAYFLNIPIVLHIHGGYHLMSENTNFILSILIKSSVNISNSIIVLSELEKVQFKKKFQCKSEKNIWVLPNCVDIDESWSILEKREQTLRILFLGRIEKSKGIWDILSALNLLKDVNYIFYLCGTGNNINDIVDEFKKICGFKLVVKGVLYGNSKIELLKSCDIFLLPSYYEGLPIALLETMSFGVVPIVTDVGSINVVVENNFNGFFVDKKAPTQIAEKIRLLNNDRKLLHEMSVNSRNKIIKNYSKENYFNKLNEIYENI